MSILGVESAIFGVADLAEHTRFWTDFGLPLEQASDDEATFRLASGSTAMATRGCPRPTPFPAMA